MNDMIPDAPIQLPQGDLKLLESEVAKRLLTSTELARLAYTALDGTPRVLPMLFHWTGGKLVMGAFRPSHKLPVLRAHPDVAITIDTTAINPEVLLIRGRATVSDVAGIVPEFALAQHRYWGEEAAAYLAKLDHPGTKMARIAVRPTWAGVLDFRSRFPEKMPEQ
jgi:Pyridoxamine 5'-phosphate oxidase